MNWTPIERRIVMRSTPLAGREIHIIGCGGIGARIIPALSKMLATPTAIYLWDHDTVEVKNLLRQNFALPDVGKPKAQVLADRYTTTMARCSARVEKWSDYQHGTPEGLIISAVDDWATRKQLMTQHYTPVIDCGNDGLRGQVLLGGSLGHMALTTIDAFPELVTEPDEEMRRQLSCEIGDTQTVLANQMAATIALMYFETLTKGLTFSHLGMMFSLPHGMWEIPAAVSGERWREHTFNETFRVFPGWHKAAAGQWRPDDLGMVIKELDTRVDGWTEGIIALVENALYGCGADRRCGCEHCVRLMIPALQRLGLTEMPPPMVDGWGKVDVNNPPSVVGVIPHRHRQVRRRYECENCGENYAYDDANDAGSDDPDRFCCENCSTEWAESHSTDDEEPEPEPEADEDEFLEPTPYLPVPEPEVIVPTERRGLFDNAVFDELVGREPVPTGEEER